MVPDFDIVIIKNKDPKTGESINQQLKALMIELVITDNSGRQDDTITLNISNPGQKIGVPAFGETLSVSLGYMGQPLQFMNKYQLDQITRKAPPELLAFSGAAVNVTGDFATLPRSDKPQPFDNNGSVSFASLAQVIADRNNLELHMSPQLRDIRIITRQDNISDWCYLYKLTREMDTSVKLGVRKKNDNPGDKTTVETLNILKRGLGKSANGKKIPEVKLYERDLWNYQVQRLKERHYDGVTAYYSKDKGDDEKLFDSDKDPRKNNPAFGLRSYPETVLDKNKKQVPGTHLFPLPHVYPTEDDAVGACKRKMAELERRVQMLTFTVTGNPWLQVETPVDLHYINPKLPAERWIVNSAIHTINANGFTTRVTAYLPAGGEKSQSAE